MRKWLWVLLAIVVIAGITVWWDNGLQGWMSIQTGTRCGTTGPQYCYWSGFGSVFPWSWAALGGVFTAILLVWRHHTCGYTWWCWRRPQHQVGDSAHMICAHHHPHVEPISVKQAVADLKAAADA